MKVRELRERLQKIQWLGFDDYEVVIKTADQNGNLNIVPVVGFIHKGVTCDEERMLRLYSEQEAQNVCDDWEEQN